MMLNNKEYILLTHSQIESLIEFIDLYFIQTIQNDEEIDSMEYLCNICKFYTDLIEAKERIGINNTKTTEVCESTGGEQ